MKTLEIRSYKIEDTSSRYIYSFQVVFLYGLIPIYWRLK